MFQIKICGITNQDDTKTLVETGADALGLNFYPKSPRYITPETAAKIIEALPRRIVKVGLFVNEAIEVVAKTFDTLGLDLIQLHGDEPPEYIFQLETRPVMKAFRLTAEGLGPIEAYLAKYFDLCKTGFQPVSKTDFQPASAKRQVGNLSYVLIDSHVAGVYGGSGVPADWIACAKFSQNPHNPPLVLAGGLTPCNIAQAIHEVRPAAVDTASGVESAPGRKDCNLVAAFVENARSAFLSTDG
jgi:phosphoribosylanthranilate isomerase